MCRPIVLLYHDLLVSCLSKIYLVASIFFCKLKSLIYLTLFKKLQRLKNFRAMFSLGDSNRPIVDEKLDIVITKLDDLSSQIYSLERYIIAMNGRYTRPPNGAKHSIASIAIPHEYGFVTPSRFGSYTSRISTGTGLSIKINDSRNRLAISTLVLACVALIFAIVAASTNCWLKIKGSCHKGIFRCGGNSECGNVVQGTAVFMIMAICAIFCGTISILGRIVNCPGMLCIRKGAAVSLLVGGTTALIAVIVYGTKHNTLILPEDESESSGLGYSYFLAAVAGFFALVTGVIVCIDASIRVKKRQPVLNSDGFGEFRISKHIKEEEIEEEGESEVLETDQIIESKSKLSVSDTSPRTSKIMHIAGQMVRRALSDGKKNTGDTDIHKKPHELS